jgi:limonene-1,2-epoxide hydrolase
MSERPDEVVRSLLEVMTKGDVAAILTHFADEASYRVNAWNEPLDGIDAIRKELERQLAMWSDFRFDLINVASSGNVVFTERIDTVHMMGRDLDIHVAGVFSVGEDGKISSWRDYFDMKEVESQLAG